jgi:hypothetical protein
METLIDKLLDVIFWFLKGVISLLPEYTIQNTGMIQTLVNWLATFNQYLPMVEMVESMIVYLTFCGLYLLVKPILKMSRLS